MVPDASLPAPGREEGSLKALDSQSGCQVSVYLGGRCMGTRQFSWDDSPTAEPELPWTRVCTLEVEPAPPVPVTVPVVLTPVVAPPETPELEPAEVVPLVPAARRAAGMGSLCAMYLD